jgi:DNA-binding beta-propeller fold protein YncE
LGIKLLDCIIFGHMNKEPRMFSVFRKQIAVFFVLCVFAAGAVAQSTSAFHILSVTPLGGDGSWDYLRFDSVARRLFIARSTRVMVVNLATHKLLGEIPGTDGVHGVAFVADAHRGVTSNGKANTASVFDLDSLKVLATVPTGEKPDGILYEPFTRTVLTMNGHADSVTIIHPRDAKAEGEIALPGAPETPVSDGKGHVYINLEDKAQIAVVDMRTRKVVTTWNLAGCVEPTGLAMDLANGKLFSGCHNGTLVVVDTATGSVIQKLPIGLGVDAVAYDPQLHLIFTSNKEGSVSVIEQVSATRYRNRETVTTLPGAKTMALDPMRHLVYTVGNRDGQFVLLEIGR